MWQQGREGQNQPKRWKPRITAEYRSARMRLGDTSLLKMMAARAAFTANRGHNRLMASRKTTVAR
jgi:hypothetical protein